MSYKKMAKQVQARGAKNTPNDTMLAHITPQEAAILQARGGSGHTDPNTGLRHFDDGAGPNGDGMSGMSDGGLGGTPSGEAGPEGSFGNPTDSGSSLGFALNGIDSFADSVNATMADGFGLGMGMGIGDPSVSDMGGVLGDISDDNGFGKTLNSFLTNTAIGKAMAAIGIPGQALSVANAAVAGGKGPAQAGSSFGGIAGSIAGGALGGPVGAALGGMAGNALGNSVFGGVDNSGLDGQGVAASGANASAGSGGMGYGDLIGGLAGMYMGNRSANQYGSVINSLNDLYSPNSPYAQHMRQVLERKDAAAGRRSQYGPREAQLMGQLAQAHGQALTSPGYGNLMNQRNTMQNQGINTLLALGQKSGLFNKAGGYLEQLFGGGGGPQLGNYSYGEAPQGGYNFFQDFGTGQGGGGMDMSGGGGGFGEPGLGDYNFGSGGTGSWFN